jgi:truncated hemoglobin YjbI
MSAVPNLNIVQYEQNCLAAIAADERNLRFMVDGFGARPDHSPEEINSLINNLSVGYNRLQMHSAAASYLYQMGRPFAWQKLSGLLADLQRAIDVYREMYQNKMRSLGKVSNIGQETQDEWLKTFQANQAAANKQYKKMTAMFTRSCATCGYSLGDLYHKLEICPSGGMLLSR